MRRRQVLAAVGGAGAASLAGCLEDDCPPRADAEAPPDGWPMPGFDAANGGIADESNGADLESDPPDDPDELERWRFDVWHAIDDDLLGATSAPVVDGERVYFAYGLPSGWDRDGEGGVLFALEEASGEIDWEYDLSGRASGAPALVGDGVLVGNGDGTLARLDRDSGDLVWEADLESAVRTPVVADGWCYVQCDDGRVHAIDAESGERCWDARAGGLLERVGFGDEYEVTGRPAVTDDAVVVTSGVVDDSRTTGLVRVLERSSGEERWTMDLGRLSGAPRSPVVADELVFVVGSERLHAVTLADGDREWTFATGYATSSPAVDADTVYLAAKNVYAIDRESGRERWRHVNLAAENTSLGGPDRVPMTAPPAVAGDFVAVGFGALERERGDHLWGDVGNDADSEYFHGGTPVYGPPMAGHAVANGAVYATSLEGRVAKVKP